MKTAYIKSRAIKKRPICRFLKAIRHTPTALAIGLLATLLSLFIWIGLLIVQYEAVQYERRQYEQVYTQLDELRSSLRSKIYENIYKVLSIRSIVELKPDLTQQDFTKAMQVQFRGEHDLRNIGLAKDMILQFVYPTEGNESAVGIDYRTLPEQLPAVEHALKTNEIVLAGPLSLVQGGIGIIARIPIYVSDDDSSAQIFWGFASAVIDAEELFIRTGINAETSSLVIAIKGYNVSDSSSEVFWGDESIFAHNPVTQTVELPNSLWEMSAIPEEGWHTFTIFKSYVFGIYALIAAILTLLTSFIVYLVYLQKQTFDKLEKERNLLSEGPVLSIEWGHDILSEGSITSVSTNVDKILGYSVEEILDSRFSFISVIHPSDIERVVDGVMYNIDTHIDRFELSYRVKTKSDDIIWLYDFSLVLRDESNNFIGLRSYLYDESARKHAEESLKIAHEQLEKTAYELTENIPVGTYTMVQPADGGLAQFAFLSSRFLMLTGLTREEVQSDPLKGFSCVHPDDFDDWVALNVKTFEQKLPFYGETRVIVDGEVRWITAESLPRMLTDGSTVWEGVLTDITERKNVELRLQEANAALHLEIADRIRIEEELKIKTDMLKNLSIRDPLTGIFNRRHYDECANREWHRLARNPSPISVIMIDIDFFKLFNDNYGHAPGDVCIKRIAQAIELCCNRELDVVARYGGEEFICLLPNTDQHGSLLIANRVKAVVCNLSIPHEFSKVSTVVTISVGIATHDEHSPKQSIEDLHCRADQALYVAKANGRNRVEWFDCFPEN